MKNVFIISACIMVLAACNNNRSYTEPMVKNGVSYFTSKKDFVDYNVHNEELRSERKLGDMQYNLKYISADAMALKEIRDKQVTEKEMDEIRSHYTELLYFNFSIKNENVAGELLKYNLESAQQYKDRLTYCAFHINEDIMLVSGNDSLPCVLAQFERTFNATNGLQFILAFPKPLHQPSDVTVVFHDKLFNNGIIKARFNGSVINKAPLLKPD